MLVPDNEMKAGIFPGKVIIVEHGDSRYPSISLSTPFFFASWPIFMSGGGMSMWPALFLYLTISVRSWPGVLKSPLHEESVQRGRLSKIREKIAFSSKLKPIHLSKR